MVKTAAYVIYCINKHTTYNLKQTCGKQWKTWTSTCGTKEDWLVVMFNVHNYIFSMWLLLPKES